MRFYEFAPTAKPVLKISQPQANTPATPMPGSTPPTPTAGEATKVYPRAWQHEWIQRYLAAQMAKDAQTVKPTELDIVKAQMMHADAQRKADQAYQEQQRLKQVPQNPDAGMSFKRTR